MPEIKAPAEQNAPATTPTERNTQQRSAPDAGAPNSNKAQPQSGNQPNAVPRQQRNATGTPNAEAPANGAAPGQPGAQPNDGQRHPQNGAAPNGQAPANGAAPGQPDGQQNGQQNGRPAPGQPGSGAPNGQPGAQNGNQPNGARPGGNEAPPPPTAQQSQSPAELQLQSQGKGQQADQMRDLRQKLQTQMGQGPNGDRGGNRGPGPNGGPNGGPGGPGWADDRPGADRDGGRVVQQYGDRVIIQRGDTYYIRPDEAHENDRFLYGARDARVEHMKGGMVSTTIIREDGTRIVTVRDRDGDIVRRSRIDRGGREDVFFDETRHADRPYEDFDRTLPPIRVQIPEEQYIVESDEASEDQIEEALTAPPVERLSRAYTLDEIRNSQRLRATVRRVDVDTITFETGSSNIATDQVSRLNTLGNALKAAIDKNPRSVFLVEGHTDAVGSDIANLALSDRRAEAVAVVLQDNFGVPPENLVTQGYGEQDLKVNTQSAERANRRVTLRNITPLVNAQR
ncbi:OmpA family protein [Faunimonas pinastri]|uniref:OmpA family protein n=1 Tax=Faunimonas pinastri TaxID=1855383 RepID=UPI0015A54CB3|nr:OmpA family protein [Faunimonas pinastri]